MSKRRSSKKGSLPLLDQAQQALTKKFPVVVRQRDILWIGSDALLCRIPKQKGKLGLRFWAGHKKRSKFRTAVRQALRAAKIKYKTGDDFEMEKDGRKLDSALTETLQRVERGEGEIDLVKHPHLRTCLACKHILESAESVDEADYQERAFNAIEKHIDANPKPDAARCAYPGCIHHEDLPRELAQTMIRVGHGDKPWRDVRNVLVSTIPLVVRTKDHPKDWDFKKQDAVDRTFTELPDAAGSIYVRLGPKKVTVHLWVTPQFKSRREGVEDLPTIEDIVETFRDRGPALREWCLRKYKDLLELARMDQELES